MPRHAQPQDIDRSAEIHHFQTGLFAYHRAASVGSDDEGGAHFKRALGRRRGHAGDPIPIEDQIVRFGFHPKMERGVAAALLGQKVEEVPLRHQG